MFKLVLSFSDIDTAKIIDSAFSMLNERPEAFLQGFKLPPLINATTMKLMPKEALIKTFVASFQTDKMRVLPMIEKALEGPFGRMQIKDMDLLAYPDRNIVLTAKALMESLDTGRMLSMAMAGYLDEEGFSKVFPEEEGIFDREKATQMLMALPGSQKEYAALKLVSSHKAELIREMEKNGEAKGFPIRIDSLKILLPKGQ